MPNAKRFCFREARYAKLGQQLSESNRCKFGDKYIHVYVYVTVIIELTHV